MKTAEEILRENVPTITFDKLIGTPISQVLAAMESYRSLPSGFSLEQMKACWKDGFNQHRKYVDDNEDSSGSFEDFINALPSENHIPESSNMVESNSKAERIKDVTETSLEMLDKYLYETQKEEVQALEEYFNSFGRPKPDIREKYKQWCAETKRNGSALVGGSIYEFFEWLEEKS